ncbi:hypothetical protein ACE6H2_027420 [Prunus campanulata]
MAGTGNPRSQGFRSLRLVLLLLLLLSFSLVGLMEARPLTKERGTMEGLSVGMMKSSGPSKGDGGHRGRLHSRILPDQIKDNSGPSPGVGHGYSGATIRHP